MNFLKKLGYCLLSAYLIFPALSINAVAPQKPKKKLENKITEFKQAVEQCVKDTNKVFLPMEWFGLEYDRENKFYYSRPETWQKEYGFDDTYDEIASFLKKEKIEFEYDNKSWVIWLWKGNYGPILGNGAELGTYIKDPFKKDLLPITIEYRGANDDEILTVNFSLKHKGKEIFEFKPQKHWWLAGFKPYIPDGKKLSKNAMYMEATITFPTEEMAKTFETAAISNRHISNIKTENNNVSFSWK